MQDEGTRSPQSFKVLQRDAGGPGSGTGQNHVVPPLEKCVTGLQGVPCFQFIHRLLNVHGFMIACPPGCKKKPPEIQETPFDDDWL